MGQLFTFDLPAYEFDYPRRYYSVRPLNGVNVTFHRQSPLRDGSDARTVEGFRALADISDAQWIENETDRRREFRKARCDEIKAFLSRLIVLMAIP